MSLTPQNPKSLIYVSNTFEKVINISCPEICQRWVIPHQLIQQSNTFSLSKLSNTINFVYWSLCLLQHPTCWCNCKRNITTVGHYLYNRSNQLKEYRAISTHLYYPYVTSLIYLYFLNQYLSITIYIIFIIFMILCINL